MTVAALFVDEAGPYASDPRFDAWGVTRDARSYAGTAPAVCHPPCKRWGRYAWGTPGNQVERMADDGGTFHVALSVVRSNGGVIEHPKDSLAWEWFGLPVPPAAGWSYPDSWGGRSIRIDQGAFGHPCDKPTWLYAVLPDTAYPDLARFRSTGGRKVESLSSSDPWRWRTPDQLKNELYGMAASCAGWLPKRGRRQGRLPDVEVKPPRKKRRPNEEVEP